MIDNNSPFHPIDDQSDGVSIRAEFAKCFMAQMINAVWIDPDKNYKITNVDMAVDAVNAADALIQELNKPINK